MDEGSGLYCGQNASIDIEGSVIAFGVGEVEVCCSGGTIFPICCDIFGNSDGDWGGCIADQEGVNGNISADPEFCHPLSGDFTLCSSSPCLPGNHPDGDDCGLIGAFGEGCSGPSAVEHVSWGEVKKLFR